MRIPPESKNIVTNPGMGWYHPYYFRIEDAIDEFLLLPDLRKNEWLCLVEISLESYRTKELNAVAKEHLRGILEFFFRNQKEVILRISYDLDGNAKEKEPEDIEHILYHMEQLREFLAGYEDAIFLYQGLFIGNWGEMHSSNFATSTNIGILYKKFRDLFGSDAFLAVRRFMYVEYLEREFGDDPRLGIFDDAMFADESDMGTFLDRESEIHLLSKRAVPFGGEVLFLNFGHGMDEIKKYPLSYLNSRYDLNALNIWKNEGIYEEVSLRLGYRLVLRDLCFSDREKITLRIENTGLAPCPFDIHLFLCDENGKNAEMKIIPRGALAQGQIVSLEVSHNGCQIFYMRTPSGKTVYFANEGWENQKRIVL